MDIAALHHEVDVTQHHEAGPITELDPAALDRIFRLGTARFRRASASAGELAKEAGLHRRLCTIDGRYSELGFARRVFAKRRDALEEAHHAARQQSHRQDRERAIDHLLQPGIDVDERGEHRDEGRANHRPQGRVDAADQHHDENVQGHRPIELTGRNDAEEREQPSGGASHRGGDAEHADLDQRSARARRLREAFGVANCQEHRIERRLADAPNEADAQEQGEHDAPSDRRAQRLETLRKVGKCGAKQSLQPAGDLEIGRQHRQHERENEGGDREIKPADPQRHRADREPDEACEQEHDQKDEEDVPAEIVDDDRREISANREEASLAQRVEARACRRRGQG